MKIVVELFNSRKHIWYIYCTFTANIQMIYCFYRYLEWHPERCLVWNSFCFIIVTVLRFLYILHTTQSLYDSDFLYFFLNFFIESLISWVYEGAGGLVGRRVTTAAYLSNRYINDSGTALHFLYSELYKWSSFWKSSTEKLRNVR